MNILERCFDPGRGSYFLFGPRGTGKSTWVRRAYPRAAVVDLLDPAVQREYAARPERLIELVRGLPPVATVVIDEIQKVPELLSSVHLLIEEEKRRRFVMTGSSARKLKRSGADLLGGRAALRTLHPFMAAELGDRFRLNEALERGLLPLVIGAKDPTIPLAAYVGLYLREEVQMEGLVRSLGGFSRFLEIASFSHAGIINACNLAREAEVGRMAVEGHLTILEDLLVAFRVPVFTRRARRAMTNHPKFYYADTGIFRTLRPAGPLDRREEIDGQALEGLVAQHLRAWCEYRGGGNRLHFWRSRGGVEVDFVVYGPDGFWGIEVKNTGRIGHGDLRGLREFKHDYPQAKTIFLYRGNDRLLRDETLCLPVEAFLRGLTPRRKIGSE